MPRLRTRLAGILFAALVAGLVAGCGAGGRSGASLSDRKAPSPTSSAGAAARRTPTPAATLSPTPAANAKVGPPAASQNLTFKGDVNGTMTALVTQSAQTPSACSERAVESATWASTLYGTINGDVYGFVASVKPYNGPGTYTAAQAQVQLFSVTDQTQTWESLPGDSVSFTVNNDNLTGSVKAKLTNLGSNGSTLSVTGSWSCAP